MKVKSTKAKIATFPIHDYYKNFIFTEDNEVWVGYRLERQTFPLNDLEFFESYIEDGEGLLEHDEYEYHFMNIPNNFDVKEHIKETTENIVQGDFKDIGTTYFNRSGDILVDEVQMNKYQTYFFIKLTTVEQIVNPIEFWDLFKEQLKKTIKNMTGQDSGTEILLSNYIFEEKQLFSDLLNYKSVNRIDENEIERIIYYQFHRSNTKIPQRSINSLEMSEGKIVPETGYLTIEQLEKTHYLSFITLIDIPPSTFGSAFIQDVQDSVAFPIETQIRIRFNHEEADRRKLRTKRKRIFEQDKDSNNVDAIIDDDEVVLFGEERLSDLNKSLKSKSKRLCRSTIFFVVSADSKEELEDRIKQLEFILNGTKYTIYRPLVDQLTLFNQSLIGSKYSYKCFEQVTTTGYIADFGLDLNKNVGNVYGMPIGRVITSKKFKDVRQAISFSSNIVWFFPSLAKKAIEGATHTNGNTVITGPPGMGKSVLVKNIFLWSSFLGQKVLYVDPKNETEKFFKLALEQFGHIPEFVELYNRINFITLSEKEENRGILDPLIFLPREQAIQTARSVLGSLAEIQKNSQTETSKKAVIIEAIDQIMNSDKPKNLLRVIDLISKKDSELGKILSSFNVGLGKVLLGNDESKAISFKNQVNVLGIQGLKTPTKKQKETGKLNEEQISSSVTMEVINKLTYVFSIDKEEDAVIIYDEAKGLEDTSEGEQVMDENLRQGRANNTDVYIVTQAFMDVDKEDKKELISYKFAFKPKQEQAQEKILSFFDMEANDRNKRLVKSLKSGTCLFQDHMGRNQPIAVDVMFDEWMLAISSTKKDDPLIKKALEMERSKGV